MFKSAIVKLTLWYVTIIMLLSVIFSFVLYHFGTGELSEGLNDQYHRIINDDHDSDNYRIITGNELNTRSKHLVADLVYFNIVVFVGSFIASYALARRTLKPIEEAHKAQVRFTAEASHELRTPLAAIRADTEAALMKKHSTVNTFRQTLQDNLTDIDKLEKLSNHLIEISRHGSSAVNMNDVIQLDQALTEVVSSQNNRINDKKIEISLKTVSAEINGESQGISQLLTIVLDNAIKYSNKGDSIKIKMFKNNKRVNILIEDSGIGIPEADLDHVFERFYRSKNTSKHTTGYGLGLPLAKDIVELHNGTISITSVEGTGTVVVITFPIQG
jgi:signal transduction histidine kinase